MRTNNFTTILLTIAVLLLFANLLKEWTLPPVTHAQSLQTPLYIEPGVYMMRAPNGSRQVLGKIVIDLATGNVWGFPTTTQNPYPVDVTSTDPPVSKPFRLGKFDLAAMNR